MEVMSTSQLAGHPAAANFSGTSPAVTPPSVKYNSNNRVKQFVQPGAQKAAAPGTIAESPLAVNQGNPVNRMDQAGQERNLAEAQAGKMTEEMNKFMERLNTDIHFTLHEKTERLMLQVVDRKNGEVIKEIPTEEMLDMIAKISEYVGVLLDKKA